MARRERWDIIGAILVAIALDQARGGARPTRVAEAANVAYDRLVLYLDELRAAGLIAGERVTVLTPKGRDFVTAYLDWKERLTDLGVPRLPPGVAVLEASEGEDGR